MPVKVVVRKYGRESFFRSHNVLFMLFMKVFCDVFGKVVLRNNFTNRRWPEVTNG